MLYYRIKCWKMLVGQLVVWGWLTTTCLAHDNHICPKTETVEVKVAVPHQEPVTFRSYTWCLKVPPRCSKYTVVMRERITYETEVRNQTLSECCSGFVSLYGSCVAACLSCTNMQCDSSRNCTCAPGYIGPHCNQTCDAGKWGDRCLEACICRVGEDCDPVTGSCSLSTSTPPPPTTANTPILSSTPVPIVHNTHKPSTTPATVTTRSPTVQKTLTTANTFVDLTLTGPTTSSEDLTDFNVILRQKINDSLRFTNTNNNDENSLNALGDLDYPVLPTDSAVESFNYMHEPTKNIVVNSLNINSSLANDRWISELGAHSGVTFGSALGLIALLVVTVSLVIRCRNNKATKHLNTSEKNSLHLVARSSHYAIPAPPSFSFINGYGGLDLAKGISEENYDHPCSVRCLVANEPVYDELKY